MAARGRRVLVVAVGVITVDLVLVAFGDLIVVVFDVVFRRRVGFVAGSFNAVVVLFFVFFVVVAAAFLVVVDFAVFVEAFVSATFVVFGFDATRFFGVFVVFVVVVVAGIEATWSTLSDLLVANRRRYAGSAANGACSTMSCRQLLVMAPGSNPNLNACICIYKYR